MNFVRTSAPVPMAWFAEPLFDGAAAGEPHRRMHRSAIVRSSVGAAAGLVVAAPTWSSVPPSAQCLVLGAIAILSRLALAALWRGPTACRVVATIVITAILATSGALLVDAGSESAWWLAVCGCISLFLGLVPTFQDLRTPRGRAARARTDRGGRSDRP